MIALGFDTSVAHCAVAVVSRDAVLADLSEPMARGQAERLIPMIEEAFAAAGIGWGDLGVVGVGTGPGNFTGLRVAVAAARGMALGADIPAVGVPSGTALSRGMGPVTVALPAPRGGVHLVFGAEITTADGGSAVPVGWPMRVTGPGADRVAGAAMVPAPPWAASVARIAASRAHAPGPPPAPVYLRPADAAPASDPPPLILDG